MQKEHLFVNINLSFSIFTYMYSVQSTEFTPAAPSPINTSLQSACCSGASQWSVHETDLSV
jgi:hypothetical protein